MTRSFFTLMFVGFFVLQGNQPRFEDHLVKEQFKHKPTKVDLKSHPDARRYRTRLRQGAAQGPNFAGHYRVVLWGCGTACHVYAIIDLLTGKVFMFRDAATSGLMFRQNSKMLIIDPIDAQTMKSFDKKIPDWLTTRYYVWDGATLTQIDSSKSVINNSDKVQ